MARLSVTWETQNHSSGRRWLRRGLVLLAVFSVAWIFWSVRGALLPFLVGAVLVYLLAPIVDVVERRLPLRRRFPGLARSLAILFTYAVSLGVLAGAASLFVPPLIQQTNEFIRSIPEYWATVTRLANDWLAQYEANVPPNIRNQIEGALSNLWSMALSAFQRAMRLTFGAVGAAIGFLSAVVLVPFWMYYVLKDSRRAAEWFYGLWPPAWRRDVQAIARIVDRTLAAYIRGQLLLGVIIGVATGIAMWAIGLTQPIALGLIAGVLELIPILGPVLTFMVIVLVALATDPSQLVWVGLAFIVIQQLENNLLVPRVHGHVVEMNPAVVMIVVVTGGALWGFPGMVVAVPLAAVARDIFRYLYRRWSEPVSPEASSPEGVPVAESSVTEGSAIPGTRSR